MIKTLLEKRLNALIEKSEVVAYEMAEWMVDKQQSESVIQQSQAGIIPPHLLKRYWAIQNEIMILGNVFKAWL